MNQRHPQSRHTPHGGSVKTDTEKGTRVQMGLRVGVGSGSQSLRLIMCALYPSLALARLTSLSSPPPPPLVPRVPDSKFVPRGVGVGRAVRWVHRAQVPGLGGLVCDALKAGRRRASVRAHSDSYTALGI